MKKILVVTLVALFAMMVVSCASKKKCPAYSKIDKTEVRTNA